MKPRLIVLFVMLAGFALLLSLLPGTTLPANAQRPQPTSSAPLGEIGQPSSDGSFQTRNGLWVMPAGATPKVPPEARMPKATGGPDQFGYTWNDGVAFSWIDATGGTDTGLGGSTYVTSMLLPFSFKYYENAYSTLYISKYGYAGFTNVSMNQAQGRIPNPSLPNNIIAPYWAPFYVNEMGYTGKVYTLSGGTEPNRYVVIEWYQVRDQATPSSNIFTFEAILHENSNIQFQYLAMTLSGSYFCGSSGIEDSMGLDGLPYTSFCSLPSPNKAVLFTRPALAARVTLSPLNQGRFTHASTTETFQFVVRNTGDLGADTYDLITSTTWTLALYAADGVTPLTDTNGNSIVDTGPISQGSSFTVTAKITVPAVTMGASNTAVITARSSLDNTKQKTTNLQLGIPSQFAQVYRDSANNAMSLDLVQPGNQATKKATANNYSGSSPAVAETTSGNFAYVWYRYRCLDNNCTIYVGEIEYTLLDKYGAIVKAVTKLTDNNGSTFSAQVFDYSPVVAVAPNGRIGIAWTRDIYNGSTGQDNYNIYLAMLDAAGNVVVSPTNITNNTSWGIWGTTLNVPFFYNPRIAATADNRFVIPWQRYHWTGTTNVYNVWYAVRDTSGSLIADLTSLTSDGNSYIHAANRVGGGGNGAIVTWYRTSDWNAYYAVVNSAGALAKAETVLSNSGQGRWASDAVALPNGNTFVAWINYDGTYPNRDQLAFAILDTSYIRIVGPIALNNPLAATGNNYVSATTDPSGNVILTWTDYNTAQTLYYALISSGGTVMTPPMIFRTSPMAGGTLSTSTAGYGNTSYSFTPPTGVDMWVQVPSSVNAPVNSTGSIAIKYGNHGASTAISVVMTATLPVGLTYNSDTSGVTPTVGGGTVVWNLPNAPFSLSYSQFVLVVNTPNVAPGTIYAVNYAISSAGVDAVPSDNIASGNVVLQSVLNLPLILR